MGTSSADVFDGDICKPGPRNHHYVAAGGGRPLLSLHANEARQSTTPHIMMSSDSRIDDVQTQGDSLKVFAPPSNHLQNLGDSMREQHEIPFWSTRREAWTNVPHGELTT